MAHIAKELWNWTDTYTIEVADLRDALCALMVVACTCLFGTAVNVVNSLPYSLEYY